VVKLREIQVVKSVKSDMQNNLAEEFQPKNLVLDIDSTSHVQSGNKIEGVAWNYKKEWCLDTQEIFNQLGFCHSLFRFT